MFRRSFALIGAIAAVVLAGLAPAARADEPSPPVPLAVAPGVWLIPGGIAKDRQPDGNTVIFRAPRGLVVMDTGRHVWHRRAILAFARAQGLPIVAIVNSHWHLDHVSGNADLKRAYPAAKVYASNAVDGALKGFLPRSAEDGRKHLAAGALPPDTLDDLRHDLATIDNGASIRPDVVVTRSGARALGGLRLRVNLAPHAATDGDVWVFDPSSGVAAVGDLVTLPAPFLDTACSRGWRRALDQVWATPFRVVVPGHGAPMTRPQFGVWRDAFNAFIDCAASARGRADCAADWTRATALLRGDDPIDARRSQGMADYYVGDVLRPHHGDSAYCAES